MMVALNALNAVTGQVTANAPPANAPTADPQVAALLQELRDIHLPEPGGIGVAPGWLILAAGCLLLGMLLVIYLLRRKPDLNWRDAAIAEMEQIRRRADDVPAQDTLAACSRLLRRVGLSLAPREQVASLTGTAWLGRLDQWHGSTEFTRGPGSLLRESQYRPGHQSNQLALEQPQRQDPQVNDLLGLVEDFIQQVGRR